MADADAITYALGVSMWRDGMVDTLTNHAVVLTVEAGQVVAGRARAVRSCSRSALTGTGNVTLDQLRSVVHNDPADPDEPGASAAVLSAANLVTLTATITDGDGDTDTAVANIGGSFQFEDDGPSATIVATGASVVMDEFDRGASCKLDRDAGPE